MTQDDPMADPEHRSESDRPDWERRLRKLAESKGLQLVKLRHRGPDDLGVYRLQRADTGQPISAQGWSLALVDDHLRDFDHERGVFVALEMLTRELTRQTGDDPEAHQDVFASHREGRQDVFAAYVQSIADGITRFETIAGFRAVTLELLAGRKLAGYEPADELRRIGERLRADLGAPEPPQLA